MAVNKKYKEIDYKLMKEKLSSYVVEADEGLSRINERERKIKKQKNEEMVEIHKRIIIEEWEIFNIDKGVGGKKVDEMMNNVDYQYNQLENKQKSPNIRSLKDEKMRFLANFISQIETDKENEKLETETEEVDTSLPRAVVSYQCHDEELKSRLLQRVVQMDTEYACLISQLNTLSMQLYEDERGNWQKEEKILFDTTTKIYNRHNNTNLLHNITPPHITIRKLLMEMLLVVLSSKNRKEILDYEKWREEVNFKSKTKKKILLNWKGNRKSLELLALNIMEKSNVDFMKSKEKYDENEERKKNSDAVKQQIDKWKKKLENENEEFLKIKHQIEEVEKEASKHRFLSRVKFNKEKLEKYREVKEKELNHLKELEERKKISDQKENYQKIKYIKERVEFRKKERELELIRKLSKMENKKKCRNEKIMSINAALEKWKPRVGRDLQRTFGETETSKAKQSSSTLESTNLYTFSDDRITADPRFLIEEKMRQACLITHPYARDLICNAPSLTKPRKDAVSQINIV